MKRVLDILISFIGLMFSMPILLPVILIVWFQDFRSPFYIASRVGKNEVPFNMVKLRSMIVNADKSGVDSTSSSDSRITPIGHLIRKFKLDELTQLWNVLVGEMSLVGPRPNVFSETSIYTNKEKELLLVKPGITDLSSIVFSDEGDILKDKEDPDLSYNQIIRPWKSRLGLVYIENQTLLLDIQLMFYTAVAIISKKYALAWIAKKLQYLNVNGELVEICKREIDLYPYPPPGSNEIVLKR